MDKKWESLVLRLQDEGQRTLKNVSFLGGLAIVNAYVIVDSDGLPVLWVVMDGKKIEPSASARENLLRVLAGTSPVD